MATEKDKVPQDGIILAKKTTVINSKTVNFAELIPVNLLYFHSKSRFMLLFVKHFLFQAIVSSAIILMIVSGCNPVDNSPEYRALIVRDSLLKIDSLHKHKIDSTRTARIKEGNERFPIIHYRRTALDKHLLDSIRRVYAKSPNTMDGYRAFTTVNRKDIQYFRYGDTVMIPDTIIKDLRAYSFFPQYYPAGDSIKKILFVSTKYQCYACYDSGSLVRFAACNSGEEHKPSFSGRYAVNWKSRLRRSSLDSSWVLPFTVNFHLQAGSAFHQFDMPGRPVSHSCIRQFIEDAEWLFKWCKGAKLDSNKQFIPFTGTPVLILDNFDYSRRSGGPWRDITTSKDVSIPLPEKPFEVEEALIPISQIPLTSRGSLTNRKRYITAEDTLRARGLIREGVSLRESIDYNKLRRQKALAKAQAEKAKKAEHKPEHIEKIPEKPTEKHIEEKTELK